MLRPVRSKALSRWQSHQSRPMCWIFCCRNAHRISSRTRLRSATHCTRLLLVAIERPLRSCSSMRQILWLKTRLRKLRFNCALMLTLRRQSRGGLTSLRELTSICHQSRHVCKDICSHAVVSSLPIRSGSLCWILMTGHWWDLRTRKRIHTHLRRSCL